MLRSCSAYTFELRILLLLIRPYSIDKFINYLHVYELLKFKLLRHSLSPTITVNFDQNGTSCVRRWSVDLSNGQLLNCVLPYTYKWGGAQIRGGESFKVTPEKLGMWINISLIVPMATSRFFLANVGANNL